MKKISIYILIIVIIIFVLGIVWKITKKPSPIVTNFEECIQAVNIVMESYPRQCRFGEQTYVENIGNELEKIDLIRIDYPRPNMKIKSPLIVTGQARGNWFFEGSFPITLTNWDGLIIAQGYAVAKDDWMTTEFVQFEGTLNFTVDKDVYSNKGSLILQKDNPSGLPEYDDALEIPIVFDSVTYVTI